MTTVPAIIATMLMVCPGLLGLSSGSGPEVEWLPLPIKNTIDATHIGNYIPSGVETVVMTVDGVPLLVHSGSAMDSRIISH